MFATDDTIVAIATPPGPGGIGVVRVSGPKATAVATSILQRSKPLEPRRATLTQVVASPGHQPIDRVVATYFPMPGSYTGEDVVEISGHGSPVLLRQIVAAAVNVGARLAEPGEFTFRAYLNNRINLVQAEAVADLVSAVTPLQARAAFDQLEGTMTSAIGEIDRAIFELIARLEASLDFPDEGYHFVDAVSAGTEADKLADRISGLLSEASRGRILREGCQVAIVGKPNVGKSTLFNSLCGAQRAIVTDVAGTTRDLLTETVDLGGIPTTLVDTAGLHPTDDQVEAEGIERTRGAIEIAVVVVVVIDGSRLIDADDERLLAATRDARRLIVVSKRDLPAAWRPMPEVGIVTGENVVEVCLLDGNDTAMVRDKLRMLIEGGDVKRDVPAVTNFRHIDLLTRAQALLVNAAENARAGMAEELVVIDLEEARTLFEEISGPRTKDAVLQRIFASFCIGK